jgi:hypothetical protein
LPSAEPDERIERVIVPRLPMYEGGREVRWESDALAAVYTRASRGRPQRGMRLWDKGWWRYDLLPDRRVRGRPGRRPTTFERKADLLLDFYEQHVRKPKFGLSWICRELESGQNIRRQKGRRRSLRRDFYRWRGDPAAVELALARLPPDQRSKAADFLLGFPLK